MKKPQLKLIEIIAKNLPQEHQSSNIHSLVSGEDVLLTNKAEVNGEEVEPEKEYLVANQLIMKVDHKKRLKRAFAKLGRAGLIQYCQKYMKHENRKLEDAINLAF